MSFTIFTHNTTISSSAINDNFYHARQGTLLPLGTSELVATTSMFNLGSASRRWRNLYCNNIQADMHYATIPISTTLFSTLTVAGALRTINGGVSVFDKSMTETGYVAMLSNLLIQWGSITAVGETTITVNLPKTFSSHAVVVGTYQIINTTSVNLPQMYISAGLDKVVVYSVENPLISEVLRWVAIGI